MASFVLFARPHMRYLYDLQGTAIPNCKLVLETPSATSAVGINSNVPIAIAACVQQLKAQGLEVIICLICQDSK